MPLTGRYYFVFRLLGNHCSDREVLTRLCIAAKVFTESETHVPERFARSEFDFWTLFIRSKPRQFTVFA